MKRGRPKLLEEGKTCGYYIEPKHEAALILFARRKGFKTPSAALRAILEMLEQDNGEPIQSAG